MEKNFARIYWFFFYNSSYIHKIFYIFIILPMDPEYKLVTYTALAIVAEEGIGPLQ